MKLTLKRAFAAFAVSAALLAGSASAWAGEQTVNLNVSIKGCAGCAWIVQSALENVPGVSNAEVSYRQQAAVVTFDNDVTTVDALIEATSAYGYTAEVAADQQL